MTSQGSGVRVLKDHQQQPASASSAPIRMGRLDRDRDRHVLPVAANLNIARLHRFRLAPRT